MAFEVYDGRPVSDAGRLQREIRVYDMLDALGIVYRRADHPAAMTMEVCRDIDAVLGASMCKNLFLRNRQKTQFYLLMLPADKPFKTKELSAQISASRLSFAEPEFMEAYLGVSPGSVTVLGLMNDTQNRVRLLVDADILDSEYIGCHPCVNTSSLRLRTRDIFDVFVPRAGHDVTRVFLGRDSE